MSHEESVHRAMRRTEFDNKVRTSFFISMVNNGLPLVFVGLLFSTVFYTKSLYKTAYVFVAVALAISVAYTLWYFITYLFVYVLLYIQKLIKSIFNIKPPEKKL